MERWASPLMGLPPPFRVPLPVSDLGWTPQLGSTSATGHFERAAQRPGQPPRATMRNEAELDTGAPPSGGATVTVTW